MWSATAHAHGLYDPLPEGIFDLKFDWDPTLLFFVALAIMYFRGLRSFKGRAPIKTWQVVLFSLGISVLIISLLPPIDPLSDRLFFMHMVQHMMITSIGVPLMLFGAPFFVVMRGMPGWFRRRIYLPVYRKTAVRKATHFFSIPLVSLITYEFFYIFWHIPYFYNLALLNDLIHMVEHATFAWAAIFVWRNIIDPHPLKSRLVMPARLLFLALMEASNIGLSAFLTFSERVIYAYEGIPSPEWWTWGHLQDQQLGGLIMWVPGGFIHYFAMTVLFFVWVNQEQRKDEQQRLAQASGAQISANRATIPQ